MSHHHAAMHNADDVKAQGRQAEHSQRRPVLEQLPQSVHVWQHDISAVKGCEVEAAQGWYCVCDLPECGFGVWGLGFGIWGLWFRV